VDRANGRILKAARGGRRVVSFVLVFGALLLPVLGIYVYAHLPVWFPGNGLSSTPGQFANLLLAYGAIVVGSLVHITVDALKQSRSGQGLPFGALDNVILWVNVKETSIVMGVVSLWVALAGVASLYPHSQVPVSTALLVGYSLDSFVDLFLQRFESKATAATDALKKEIAA